MDTSTLPEVTSDLLAALELRYADPAARQVCGAPLAFATSGPHMKYACPGDEASILKHPLGDPGWQPALDHYTASIVFDPPPGDLRVIALVAEVRRLRGQEDSAA